MAKKNEKTTAKKQAKGKTKTSKSATKKVAKKKTSESTSKNITKNQTHGKDKKKIESLDELFNLSGPTFKAKDEDDYRSKLQNMYGSDLQNHAMEQYGIIPFNVDSIRDRKRMINNCVRRWKEKKFKWGSREKVGGQKYSQKSQQIAARVMKSFTER